MLDVLISNVIEAKKSWPAHDILSFVFPDGISIFLGQGLRPFAGHTHPKLTGVPR